MDNGNMPAMPQSATSEGNPCNYYDYSGPGVPTGLTKREMVAVHIFSGMMSNNAYVGDVKFAVGLADALLAELERTCQKS